MSETIGIIGVGLMGHGIALNVQKGGYDVLLLAHPGNQPLDDLLAAGAQTADTPAAIAAQADTIILCVPGSPQVEAVLYGDGGLLAVLRAGTTLIDCSTALPSSTVKIAADVVRAGGHFLDAAMTRTPKEAAQGRLNLIVGGDEGEIRWRGQAGATERQYGHTGDAPGYCSNHCAQDPINSTSSVHEHVHRDGPN